MATNPNNAIGTNAAFNGRTTPNAFNDVLASFKGRGILSGWECLPNNNMVVTLGGQAGTRDVALALDNSGNKTTINNISEQPVEFEVGTASTTSTSIEQIVAYVDDPPIGSATIKDNSGACGLIGVRGTGPNPPTEAQIRAAITADGGTGTTAYCVTLATVTIPAGATTITANNITQGGPVTFMPPITLRNKQVTSDNVDWATMKHWVPDYALQESTNLASNSKATITETGFAYISIYGYNTAGAQKIIVYVNGKEARSVTSEVRAVTGAFAIGERFLLPVSVGDVITAKAGQVDHETTGGMIGVFFIPGKWV